jgi:TetR/AcrR family transcriptional regulator
VTVAHRSARKAQGEKAEPAQKPGRRGARPKEKFPRNAELTRARILDAATAEFASKGYDGARVDEIVERCGVSKNLIYHYFDSKEALFIAVMEIVYQRMRLRHSEWSFAGLSPKEGIEKLVLYNFEHFLQDPTVIPLINTENLHRARHISKLKTIHSLYEPLLAAIQDLLRRGEKEGSFRSGVDPVELYISISALSYFYIANRHTLSFIFEQDLLEPARLERRKRHAVEVVLGYLRP